MKSKNVKVYGKKVDVVCPICKTDFKVREVDRKRGWGRFCSKSCAAVNREMYIRQHNRKSVQRNKKQVIEPKKQSSTNVTVSDQTIEEFRDMMDIFS